MKTRSQVPAFYCGLLLFSCQAPLEDGSSSTESEVAPSRVVVHERPPLAIDGEYDSILAYLTDRYDVDGDGRLSKSEYDRETFDSFDVNGDSVIEAVDFEDETRVTAERKQWDKGISYSLVGLYLQTDDVPSALTLSELEIAFSIFDLNGDGAVTETEFEELAAERSILGQKVSGWKARSDWVALARGVDSDEDGVLEHEEVVSFFKSCDWDADQVLTFKSRNYETLMPIGWRSAWLAAGPATGDLAPDFGLRTARGDKAVQLSDFRGESPVVLIFASYTLPLFRDSAGWLKWLWEEYGDEVRIFVVYVRETLPLDKHPGWYHRHRIRITSPHEQGVRDELLPIVEDPISLEERREVAKVCMTKMALEPMPVLIDDIDDAVSETYGAWPGRLYLISRDGHVAYRSKRGSWRGEKRQLEHAVDRVLGRE